MSHPTQPETPSESHESGQETDARRLAQELRRREEMVLTISRRPIPVPTILTVFAVAVALMAAWKLSFVLLMAFAAVLIAVALYNASDEIARRTPIPRLAALFLVLAMLGGAMTWLFTATGPRVGQELVQLVRSIPEAAKTVREWFEDTSLGELVDEDLAAQLEGGEKTEEPKPPASSPSSSPLGGSSAAWAAERMPDMLGALRWTVNALFNGIINMVVVLAMAIFLAIDPRPYVQGFLHLVPRRHRPRAGAVMEEIGTKMWLWLAGQMIDMIIVGTLIGVGLWLLGIPLALVLGVIAAATNIVPLIGPIISAIPGILFALTQGPQDALYAAILYLVVQQIDGNVLTPLIQKHTARLPPVLTVLGVVGFGVLFGPAGIFVATPLMLVVLICVKRFYVEDLLGDNLDEGDGSDGSDGSGTSTPAQAPPADDGDPQPADGAVSPAAEGRKMA